MIITFCPQGETQARWRSLQKLEVTSEDSPTSGLWLHSPSEGLILPSCE